MFEQLSAQTSQLANRRPKAARDDLAILEELIDGAGAGADPTKEPARPAHFASRYDRVA
jgi:hypothetical protein